MLGNYWVKFCHYVFSDRCVLKMSTQNIACAAMTRFTKLCSSLNTLLRKRKIEFAYLQHRSNVPERPVQRMWAGGMDREPAAAEAKSVEVWPITRIEKEKTMTKVATYALVIAVLMGTTAILGNRKRAINPDASADSRLATNGAFQDGMYLGKLAAENGQPPRLAVGRWSTDQDRASFTAGYERGYIESLARAMP